MKIMQMRSCRISSGRWGLTFLLVKYYPDCGQRSKVTRRLFGGDFHQVRRSVRSITDTSPFFSTDFRHLTKLSPLLILSGCYQVRKWISVWLLNFA